MPARDSAILNTVQAIFKWIDKLFQSIPESLARNIRLGFIGVWVLLAGVVSYRACVTGQDEAPQTGQDLQLSRVKEQIVREENRSNAPAIQLPDPDQILPESSAIDDLPLPEPSRDPLSTLPGSADLRERDPNPSSESLPPFLGESDEIIFPKRDGESRNGPSRSEDTNTTRNRSPMQSSPNSLEVPTGDEPSGSLQENRSRPLRGNDTGTSAPSGEQKPSGNDSGPLPPFEGSRNTPDLIPEPAGPADSGR